MHYLIIIIVIAVIIILQFIYYSNNREQITDFSSIFPEEHNAYTLDIDETTKAVLGIKSTHYNSVLAVILISINKYLSNNKGAVSDFHLMKDIVDRNCNAVEEKINTQIPIPLYLGLMGTMAGILTGVGFLVISGDLNALLGNTTPDNNVSEGVGALMGGVALAMISSIVGILLTTIGSSIVQKSKAIVEKNKNTFLSWIQAELLPNLSSDVSGALVKMSKNLTYFNKTFSSNTEQLQQVFQQINESYRSHAEMMESINRMKITEIATANIEVYDKLKNCTDEIGHFSIYLQNVNEYISNVKSLNEKLDRNEMRTKVVEDMGIFFKSEIEQIEARKGFINQTIGTIDNTLQKTFNKLQENVVELANQLSRTNVQQTEKLEKAIDEQQVILRKKLEETPKLIEELRNLTEIKRGITNFKDATDRQNKKIDELAAAIRELAQVKSAGGSVKSTMPRWLKIIAIVGGGLISLSCLIFIINAVIEIVKKLF
jgi:xanthosine utilization system XapX-like protein